MRKKTVLILSFVIVAIVGLVAGIYFINKHQQLEAMKDYVAQAQTPYERHYINENGTITAEISNTPIQYLDKETNEWKPINTSIKEKDQKYVVDEHVFQATFGKKGNEPVTFEQDGYRISYIPVNANESIADVQENEITYAEVWKHTDLQYEVTPRGLKMTLHLSDEQAPKEFAFKMLVDGMNPKLDENGSIVFFDEDGQEKFTVPSMWVKDSSSQNELYDPISVTLDKRSEDEYLLRIAIDDAGLVYPLIIDPTTTISGNKVMDAHTGRSYMSGWEQYNDYATYNTSTLKVEGTGRESGTRTLASSYALIKFDIMGIPEGSLVNSAKMRLYVTGKSGSGYYLGISRALGGWRDNTVNIVNMPNGAPLVKHYCSCEVNSWAEFDVTGDTFNMVQRTVPNYGYIISIGKDRWNDYGDKVSMTFASSESSYSPQLIVDYVPPSGWRGGAEETVTITEAEDTYLQYYRDRPGSSENYPSGQKLLAGYEYRENNGSVYRKIDFFTYIKFNNVTAQIPQDVRIKEAKLYVKKESDLFGIPRYYYHSVSPITSNWSPQNVSGTNRPNTGNVSDHLKTGTDLYFDVTYDVIRMLKGDPVYGWMLYSDIAVLDEIDGKPDGRTDRVSSFYSSEFPSPSYRPRLIITYEVNNTPPTTPGPFTAPTPGDRWYGTHTISWGASTDPDGDPVTYELEFFNGTSWKTIGTNISGTSYSYNFANEPATSSAKLRVRAKDSRGAYSDYRESPAFTINKAPGAPTILEPKNGETVFNDRAIKWTAASDPNGDALTYQLQLSTDNGTIWKDIGTTSDTSFIYNFNVEDSSAAARVRVRAYDGQLYGPWATSEAFIINGAPRITLITPLNNGINYSAPQEFKWEIRDADNDLVKSRLYVDDSPVYETGFEDAGIKTATVDLSGAYEGAHTWYVEAIDAKGAIVRSEVRTIIVQKPLHEPNVLYLPRGEVPPGEFVRDLGENRKMYRKVEQTPNGEVSWLYIVEFYDPPQGVGDLKIAP